MTNELLLVITALVDICFVFIAARINGSKALYGIIALNLILITIFGIKLITVFGLTTNVGNVFYACVFLATHFLLERQDKKKIYRTIGFGVAAVGFFLVLSQLATCFLSTTPGDIVDNSMSSIFTLSPRIALASILAYIFAQFVNIHIYSWLKTKTGGNFLWLRSNVANILAQLVDSCLFFTIAFLDLPGGVLIQAIFAGWMIKTFVVLMGTPLLYLDAYIFRKKQNL
jgi:uncharacterized integral membrane protein (TIGR00697 family)